MRNWEDRVLGLERRIYELEEEVARLRHTSSQNPVNKSASDQQTNSQHPPQARKENNYSEGHSYGDNRMQSPPPPPLNNQQSFSGMSASAEGGYNQAFQQGDPGQQRQGQQSAPPRPPYNYNAGGGPQVPPYAAHPGNQRHAQGQIPPHPGGAGGGGMQPSPDRGTESLETKLARVWLPRVFIVVLLLGVLWGFLAIVANGYLSQELRCLLGVLLATGMYIYGSHQVKNQRPGIGMVLIGGSTGVYLLSVSAAHLLYNIINIPVAILLYAAVLALIMYSAFRWKSQTLMIVTILAGYLMPFLAAAEQTNGVLFVIYSLVFSVTMLAISRRFFYSAAYWLAFILLQFSMLIGLGFDYVTEQGVVIAAAFVQHIAIFIFFVLDKRLRSDLSALQFISFLFTVLWTFLLYREVHQSLYAGLLLFVILLYTAAVIGFIKKSESEKDHSDNWQLRVDISFVIVTAAIMLLSAHWMKSSYWLPAWLMEGTIAIIVGYQLRCMLQKMAGTIITVFTAIIIIGDLPSEILSPEMLGWTVLLISMPILYWVLQKFHNRDLEELANKDDRLYHQRQQTIKTMGSFLLWAEAAFGLAYLSLIVSIASKGMDIDIRHFTLSGAWLVYAAGAIIIGIAAKQPKARLTGMFFLFVILLKVIIVDVPDISLAVRAILFIVLGGVGIVVSRLLYTSREEKKTQ